MLDIYDAVISIIGISEQVANSNSNSNQDEIIVRTSIQKLVYLTQQICYNLELPKFKPYFYGPYSTVISLVLEELVVHSLLHESKIVKNGYPGHRYRLSMDGKSMEEHVKKKYKNDYENITRLIEKCNKVCHLRVKPLSYAAKMHYMLTESEKKKMTMNDFEIRGKELGWDLKNEDLRQGMTLLKEIGMIKGKNDFVSKSIRESQHQNMVISKQK